MTQLLGMQSIGVPRYCDSQLDLRITPEMSTLYGTQENWACPPRGSQSSMTPTTYMDFSLPTLPSSVRHDSMFHHNHFSNQDDEVSDEHPSQRAYTQFVSAPDTAATTATFNFTPNGAYSASSTLTATNSTAQIQNPTTMAPLMTRFDKHDMPSPDGQPHSAKSYNFAHLPSNHNQPLSKQRRKSLPTGLEAHSPTISSSPAGRRRKSEYAEPGSARAIYLEKNRKAASKCRNKQKRQQDELVEMAREVERRNKLLKAEVELLRAGMRELMDVVAKHNHCPDNRLKLYVQREANRLAAGNQNTTPFSSPSNSSSCDGKSPSKSASP